MKIRKKRKRWLPEWNALLGTMPDSILSEQLQIAGASIRFRRKQFGIPAFKGLRVFPCGWCGKDVMRHRNHQSLCCDECQRLNNNTKARDYRKQHRAQRRAQMLAWTAANREHCRKWHRAWYAANPERIAKMRERVNAKRRLERRAAKEKAIDERVAAEMRAERNRLGMEHYGWARNAE